MPSESLAENKRPLSEIFDGNARSAEELGYESATHANLADLAVIHRHRIARALRLLELVENTDDASEAILAKLDACISTEDVLGALREAVK